MKFRMFSRPAMLAVALLVGFGCNIADDTKNAVPDGGPVSDASFDAGPDAAPTDMEEPPDTGAEADTGTDPDMTGEDAGDQGTPQPPCLEADFLQGVDFGNSSVGTESRLSLPIRNCSRDSVLEISGASIPTGDTVFSVDLPETDVSPGETIVFDLFFQPANTVSYDGTLVFQTNDPAQPNIEVPLSGTGVTNQCPEAVAEVRLLGTSTWNLPVGTFQTEPLQTLELRGSSSSDPDGDIDLYEWTILQRPTGSTAMVMPMIGGEQASLFVDMIGPYVVELVVIDSSGNRSCDPAILNIQATPSQELAVELVWDTPGDTDQTDGTGADLDLHYMRDGGTWDSAPWDISWRNATNDWPPLGSAAGDPQLRIDDSDGAGPELIVHEGLEASQKYHVGVDYFDSAGLGPSYATVRIYENGVLDFEFKNRFLEQGQFWHAATFDSDTGSATSQNVVTSGFP